MAMALALLLAVAFLAGLRWSGSCNRMSAMKFPSRKIPRRRIGKP